MTDDSPEPLATLHFPHGMMSATLYSDGAYVELDPDAWCSEHGHLNDKFNQARCDHNQDVPDVDPGFSIEEFSGAASSEPAIQNAAIEQLAYADPERFIKTVVPILEEMGMEVSE